MGLGLGLREGFERFLNSTLAEVSLGGARVLVAGFGDAAGGGGGAADRWVVRNEAFFRSSTCVVSLATF